MSDFELDRDPGQPGPEAPPARPRPAASLPAAAPATELPADLQRQPPCNVDAEAAALGACLFGEADVVDRVLVGLVAADFFKMAHQRVYDAITALRGDGAVIDLVSLQAKLQDTGHLVSAGGPVALAQLMERVATVTNVDAYIQIVKEKAQLRRLIAAAAQISQDAYARQNQSAEVIDAAGERILAVAEGRAAAFEAIGAGWEPHFEDLARSSRGERALGLVTGLKGWDRVLGGIIPGKVYVIGARPGEGKSTLALNLATGLAGRNTPSAFFSLEMDKEQIRDRLVAAAAEIDGSKIERGAMDAAEMDLYQGVMKTIHRYPLHLYHDPYMQLQQLLALARVAVSKMRCKVLFVDYMQMLHDDSRRFTSHAQELTEICRRLAAFARAHHVAVVEVAQVNRDLKEGEEPKVSHLKDSGGIEEAADVVALLYDKKEEKYQGQVRVPVELIFGKNRGGDRGRIELNHTRSFLRFDSN